MHEKRIPIRWSDVGLAGCVSPTAFMTYLDELVGEWLEPALAENWVTLRVELDLRAELRRDDREAVARVRLERIGRASIAARAEILRPAGELAAEAAYVVGAWDPAARRTRPVTDAERVLLGA